MEKNPTWIDLFYDIWLTIKERPGSLSAVLFVLAVWLVGLISPEEQEDENNLGIEEEIKKLSYENAMSKKDVIELAEYVFSEFDKFNSEIELIKKDQGKNGKD